MARVKLGQCRACWWRRATQRHHWLVHARWSWRRRWRQRTPTMALCTRCHERVSSWDARPATWLPLTTAAYLVWRWFWNIVWIVGIILVIRFVRAY